MKMRTVYLKSNDMAKSVAFWSQFLEAQPTKQSEWWSEFKCANINLGILGMDDFRVEPEKSNFVPVFEVMPNALEQSKERATKAGAQVIVDISEHPDKMSYVLADPCGNEFEVTKFKD
jgi:predicted enzyme related to lactoylglutathione lyase